MGYFAGKVPAVTLVLWAVGCTAEHRINLAEFQQRMRAEAVAEPDQQVPPVDVDRLLGPYKVGMGDVLSVTVVGGGDAAPAPTFHARIDRNGEIDLPLIGRLRVADLELQDVEHEIRSALVPQVLTQAAVYVELVYANSTEVVVVGAVSNPGLIPLRRTERTMLHAIAAAGGMSDLASGEATLRRIHHPGQSVTFNLRDPAELQRAIAIDPLGAGDIIEVHAAQPNTVFVGGLVKRAGPQAYPAGTEVTIMQALAAAGGIRTDVFPKEGTLIRRGPDGTDTQVKLDLNRLALGQDPNITLAPGDILWVPETWETRVQNFINQNIFLRAGVSVNYTVSGVEFLNRRNLQTRQVSGGTLQDSFDPLGFLGRNTALQGIQGTLATQP